MIKLHKLNELEFVLEFDARLLRGKRLAVSTYLHCIGLTEAEIVEVFNELDTTRADCVELKQSVLADIQ